MVVCNEIKAVSAKYFFNCTKVLRLIYLALAVLSFRPLGEFMKYDIDGGKLRYRRP